MILFAAILALQVFMIVDVMRHGRNTFWIMALMFLPLASSIAYFIIEIVPRMQGHRHMRTAKQKIVEKIDPERELRSAQQALSIADTMANHLRVGDALGELGRHKDALPHYKKAAGLRPDYRTGEKLARSLFLSDKPGDALAMMASIPAPRGQSERDRADLLRARILEDLGRDEEALPLYEDVSRRLPGDEARCRYAALLLRMKRRDDARAVLEEVEHRYRSLDRYSRQDGATMYEWAFRELQGLRTA